MIWLIKLIKNLRRIKKSHYGISEELEVAYGILEKKENPEMKKILDRFSEYIMVEDKIIPMYLKMLSLGVILTVFFPAICLSYLYVKKMIAYPTLIITFVATCFLHYFIKNIIVDGLNDMEKRLTNVFKKYFDNVPINELGHYDSISDIQKIWDFVEENEEEKEGGE